MKPDQYLSLYADMKEALKRVIALWEKDHEDLVVAGWRLG